MLKYNDYFQFQELDKVNNRRKFELNYVNIKKEIFSGGGKGIWTLQRDTEYSRHVSGKLMKKFLIERLYNQVDKGKVFELKKGNKSTDNRKYHFLQYLELILYFYDADYPYMNHIKEIDEELENKEKVNHYFQEEVEVDSLYGHSSNYIMDCLVEQLLNTKLQESENFIKKLARDILYDIFYIIKTEQKNVFKLRGIIEDISLESNLISRLWTDSYVLQGNISEIQGADLGNKFTYLYNQLYYMCHSYDKDTRKFHYNVNKIYAYKLGYKWGFASRKQIRQIYKLILMNFDVDVIQYLQSEWKLGQFEEKYIKFISLYYVDLLKITKVERTDDFDLIFVDKPIGNEDNIKSLPYFETFKSDFYETLFDIYVSSRSNNDSINNKVRGTYLTYYDKKYKEDINVRLICTGIVSNIYDCIDKYKLDVKRVPLTKLMELYLSDNKDSISKSVDIIFGKKSKSKKVNKPSITETNKRIIESNRYNISNTIKNIPKVDKIQTEMEKVESSINDLFEDSFNSELYENLSYDELYIKVKDSLYKSIVKLNSSNLLSVKETMDNIIKKLSDNNKLKNTFYNNRTFNEFDSYNQDELEDILYEIALSNVSYKKSDIEVINRLIKENAG